MQMRQTLTSELSTFLAQRAKHALKNPNPGLIILAYVIGGFFLLILYTQNNEHEKASRLNVGAVERSFALPVLSPHEFAVRTAHGGYDAIFHKNVPDHEVKETNEKIGARSMEDIIRQLEIIQRISFPQEV